jgi:multiple sugar transport system substrate-binding protein
MSRLTRRGFGALAGTALGSLALGVGGRDAFAETRLRFYWWGNPERNKRTYEVVELYKNKQPEIAVVPETLGWDDYWTKMATQASGRNMADVVQMDYRYLFEYARRDTIAPLDEYAGNQLDLSGFDDKFLDSGRVGGKLYAIPWTSNSAATYYNSDKMTELGVAMPDHNWTWDDLKRIGTEIQKGLPEGSWAVADKGVWEPMLEFWLRQRGKALYTEDGDLGYTEEDLAEYLALWDDFRQAGLLPPGDITSQDTSVQTFPISLGKAVIDWAHSNQLVAMQKLNPNKLGMNMLPNLPEGQKGQYLKPSMLISVAGTSEVKPEAVAFASYLASDPDAAAILRVERGVPGDEKIRDLLLTEVDEQEKMMIDYMKLVADNVSPLPPPPPKGAGEIEKALLRFYPQIAFGRMDVKEAASTFYGEAQAIRRRG